MQKGIAQVQNHKKFSLTSCGRIRNPTTLEPNWRDLSALDIHLLPGIEKGVKKLGLGAKVEIWHLTISCNEAAVTGFEHHAAMCF